MVIFGRDPIKLYRPLGPQDVSVRPTTEHYRQEQTKGTATVLCACLFQHFFTCHQPRVHRLPRSTPAATRHAPPSRHGRSALRFCLHKKRKAMTAALDVITFGEAIVLVADRPGSSEPAGVFHKRTAARDQCRHRLNQT